MSIFKLGKDFTWISPTRWSYITVVKFPLGMASFISITPQKYIFLPGHEGCRNKPLNEMVFVKLAKEITNKCTAICQPFSYGRYLNSKLGYLKLCTNASENKCFQNVVHSIIGSIDDKKPCTKLNYEVDISQMRTMDHNGQLSAISANQATFAIHILCLQQECQ